MQTGLSRILLCLLLAALHTVAFAQVDFWLTNPDKSVLFQKQSAALTFAAGTNEHPTIAVDDSKTFQTIDGFGFTLTGGSATHIIRMDPAPRAALLRELFAIDGTNIGTSYLRLSIGASDLNERVFSYNDLSPGETDPEMKKFDLGPDRADVVPVLKEILAINLELCPADQ
jgi:glucosylceramidase